MKDVIVQLVCSLIVAAGVLLAARYPRAFGFLAWEFGVTPREDEAMSAYYLRGFKYWCSVTTFGMLLAVILYYRIDLDDYSYSQGVFYFLLPILFAAGYIHALIDLALHAYHRSHGA